MILRDETPADHEAITRVTKAAFADHPFSRQTEHFIIQALRADGALSLSLVAEDQGLVVGHIAFSPLTISDGSPGWYGMGPVSVLPARQRRGIGGALVNLGLSRLREMGAQGCALVGDPGYYQRFGFKNHPRLLHPGVPPEFFVALPLTPGLPQGQVEFHPGFKATG